MRLTPIEKPRNILAKIAYFISKREFGKVISPLKFIYSRSIPVMMTSYKIISSEKKLSLPVRTKRFIRYYTSHLNDCPFCSDAIHYLTKKEQIELQQWKEFMNFRNSDAFSAKEKALLAYLEEVNLTKMATDDTFAELRKYFSEQEIVEITWINSTENYFNLMAKPLGLTSDEMSHPKRETLTKLI